MPSMSCLRKARSRSTAPNLLFHGALDRSSPVSTARAGHEMLHRARKRKVDHLEYDGLDHAMRSADGTEHMVRGLTNAARWIRTRGRALR